MVLLHRAVYTGCNTGIDFYSKADYGKNSQKIFSTSGNNLLTKQVINFLERMIADDVYEVGRRQYLSDVFRYVVFDDISALFHYRWLQKNETGGRGVGLTKALIGRFNCHPIEYYQPPFFLYENFFNDYFDANGQKITKYNQLLTFEKEPPKLFKMLSQDIIINAIHSEENFKQAGYYVTQPNAAHVKRQVEAAVRHLINQFLLQQHEQRKGIIIRGNNAQIRHTIAAISYAFSAKAAIQLPFSVGLPSKKDSFNYNFSTDALVGWDIETDPDAINTVAPNNLVFLENLTYDGEHRYYSAKFDKDHWEFIKDFAEKCDNIAEHPNYYKKYRDYRNYMVELCEFISGVDRFLDLDRLYNLLSDYAETGFYLKDFYGVVLNAYEKAELIKVSDIDVVPKLYDIIEKLIDIEVEKAKISTHDKLLEELGQHYINRYTDILISDFSNRSTFGFIEATNKINNLFSTIPQNRLNWLGVILRNILDDNSVRLYATNFDAQSLCNQQGLDLEIALYQRLFFIKNSLSGLDMQITKDIAHYVSIIFSVVLFDSSSKTDNAFFELRRKINRHVETKIFNNLFCKSALVALIGTSPSNVNDINESIAVYNALKDFLNKVVKKEDPSTCEEILLELHDMFVDSYTSIFKSILEGKHEYYNLESAKRPLEFFTLIWDNNEMWANDVLNNLTEEESIDRFGFPLATNSNFHSHNKYAENIIYPNIELVSYMVRKSNTKMSECIARYLCKAINAITLCDQKFNAETVFEKAFMPISLYVGDSSEKNSIGYYKSCGFHPDGISRKEFEDCLEKVFLRDFIHQMQGFDSDHRFDKTIRINLAKTYLNKRYSEGFSIDAMAMLYLEYMHVDIYKENSVLYYINSFEIFTEYRENNPELYPMLYEHSVTKMLQKITLNNPRNIDVDSKYMALISNVLEFMRTSIYHNEDPNKNWMDFCTKIDTHLGEVFYASETLWKDTINYAKKGSSDTFTPALGMANYIRKHGLSLPNSNRIVLYAWFIICKKDVEQISLMVNSLLSFINDKSIGFTDSDEKYRNAVNNIIFPLRWTGDIYCLLFQLFDFDDTFTFQLLKNLEYKETIYSNMAFTDLCKSMCLYYGEKWSNFDIGTYQKFLVQLKKVYYIFTTNPRNNWCGWDYLLVFYLLLDDDTNSKNVFNDMINHHKGSDLFLEFAIELCKDHESLINSDPITDSNTSEERAWNVFIKNYEQKAWMKTKDLLIELKKSGSTSMYQRLCDKLVSSKKKQPYLSDISNWLARDEQKATNPE